MLIRDKVAFAKLDCDTTDFMKIKNKDEYEKKEMVGHNVKLEAAIKTEEADDSWLG